LLAFPTDGFPTDGFRLSGGFKKFNINNSFAA